MYSTAISLRFASSECRVELRELTGHDELGVSGLSTGDALQLIKALLISTPNSASPLVEDLVGADRDQILVSVYARAFGDRIESTLRCEPCDISFDLDFSVRELAAAVEERPANRKYSSVGTNLFESAGGWRFRLPTGRDECDVALLDIEAAETALFERCVVENGMRPDIADLDAAMEEVAPLFEFNLKAPCPQCEEVYFVQFDIQTYLLRSLLHERSRLTFETHRLAAAYGWCLDEILSLTRTQRRDMVQLVEHEISVRRN